MPILLSLFILSSSHNPQIHTYRVPQQDNVSIIISVSIPVRSLLYVKDGNRFLAEVQMIYELIDPESRQTVKNDFYMLSDYRESFEETKGWEEANFLKTIKLPENKEYSLNVKVKDLNSKAVILNESIRVKPLTGSILLSDILPLSLEAFKRGRKKLVNTKNISQSFVAQWVAFIPNDSKQIEVSVFLDSVLVKNFKESTQGLVIDTFLVTVDSLSDGAHSLVLEFKTANETIRRSLTFYIRDLLYGYSGNLDNLIVILNNLFPGDTLLNNLRQATGSDRQTAWRRFWDAHDPTPGNNKNELLDVIVARMEYADKNFSIGNIRGSLTDRGLVYIRLGQPDEIERHPFDVDAKSYEIWYYYELNMRIVFVDRMGFGDYELYSPAFIDLIRY